MKGLSHERLRNLLSYNPCTGDFYWKVKGPKRQFHKPAGNIDSWGYRQIRIDYKLHRTGRLAWFYVYGKTPNVIDHIDRNKLNDSIWNLSNGTQKANMKNSINYIDGREFKTRGDRERFRLEGRGHSRWRTLLHLR